THASAMTTAAENVPSVPLRRAITTRVATTPVTTAAAATTVRTVRVPGDGIAGGRSRGAATAPTTTDGASVVTADSTKRNPHAQVVASGRFGRVHFGHRLGTIGRALGPPVPERSDFMTRT